MIRLIRWLFGCPHRTCTFPMRRTDGKDRVSCLECGALMEYRAEWIN